jgi:predicted HNH restriction endonuclease
VLPLAGRRTVWCSDACDLEYGRQHAWTRASYAAKKRDGFRCRRCERRPGDPRPGRVRVVHLEVHHVTPVLGQHGVFSCLHHLDGLVTLCSDCHLEVHAALRAAASDQLALS